MFTIIAFLLTLAGCINWFMIGVLQCDFVAGIFGFQGSILSRIIYVIIGLASFFLVYKLFKGKGTIAVFSRRNKMDVAKNIAKLQKKQISNIEASHENLGKEQPIYDSHYDQKQENHHCTQEEFHSSNDTQHEEGLFNEHFGED